jgi:hypothetical protein
MIFETVQEWAHCREAMLAALARCEGTHTEDDILEMLIKGQLRLLTEGGSGVVVEELVYPRQKHLNCFLVGGNLEEVLEIEKRLPVIAAHYGCSKIVCSGRHGWSKVLPNHGWKVVTTYMQKEV